MRLRNGFVIRSIDEKRYAVPVGDAAEFFKGALRLNELGEFIFTQLMHDTDENAIVEAVLNEYDADRNVVENDVSHFIRQLKNARIIVDA